MGARYEYVSWSRGNFMNQAIVIQGGEGQDIEGDVQYMSVDVFTEDRGIIF